MASLSDIVQVNVTTLTAQVKSPGFGVPLIADYHTKWVERVRYYTDLDGMVTDGFTTADAAYKAAAAIFAQNPQVTKVGIGRRANAPDLQIELTPTAQNTRVYKVVVVAPNGTSGTASYTSDGTATVAEITAGLSSAITALALTGIAATDQTTHVRVKATTPGMWFSVTVDDMALLSAKQNHVDPGIAADMDAIKLENNDWYALTMTTAGSNGTATTSEVGALSLWAESNKKLAFVSSQDQDMLAAPLTDIGSLLKAANRFRTSMWFGKDMGEFVGAAVIGATMPRDPGSITFAFRQLASVSKAALSPTHLTNLRAKNINFFVDYGGIGVTQDGKVAAGEWIDIIRDRDWYESRLQTLVYSALANSLKVPFTDAGIGVIEAQVRKATREAILAGFLAEGTDTYVIPKAADVASVDRAARRLATVKVSARVAGAIHVVKIDATITA